MDERTIKKRWDAAVAMLAANRIVKAVIRPVEKPLEPTPETPAATPANSSSKWGVTSNGSPEETQTDTRLVSGIPMRIENLLPVPLMRLVHRLKPWNPASGRPPLGRNWLEFTRPGFTLYPATSSQRWRPARARIGRVPVSARKATDPMQSPDKTSADDVSKAAFAMVRPFPTTLVG
jgi:hypothetical protein